MNMDSKTLTCSQLFLQLGTVKEKVCAREKEKKKSRFVFLSTWMSRNLSFTILFLSVYRHIENWTGLQTLRDVDMELYTGLQRL